MAIDMNPWRRRSQRRERRRARWNDRLEQLPQQLNDLRLRLQRSPDGLALGVFRGLADSLGFCVFWVRVVGVAVLLTLSSGSLLVCGFFYLLAAVLMRPPDGSNRPFFANSSDYRTNGYEPDDDYAGSSGLPTPPPMPGTRSSAYSRPAAVPFQRVAPVTAAPRVDFAELDRQLDGLNRRIQRMEGIVTDRHYDWDRRMES